MYLCWFANVYRPFLANPDPANMPILGDLYDELLRQPEPEAARIASALELYVSGSLNVFNHRTNVELSNRLVCFDIKQLGKQLTRKERTHRLCTRGGMLESFLQEPERLTDDDVMLLLKLIFHRQDTQELWKKLLERKKPETP